MNFITYFHTFRHYLFKMGKVEPRKTFKIPNILGLLGPIKHIILNNDDKSLLVNRNFQFENFGST